MRTIENCKVIKDAVKMGEGYPKIYDGKCEGYCTFTSDEPHEICKICRWLFGRED